MRLAREDVEVAAQLALEWPEPPDEDRMLECELWYVAGYEQALRDAAVGKERP
jgi:hypothetical protein